MATYRIERYGNQVSKGDLIYDDAAEQGQSVRVVDEDSLEQHTLDQVVLPLPGFNIVYPENEVGERYQAELANDGIKLTKGAIEESTAKGSYRSLIVTAENVELNLEKENSSVACNARLKFDLPTGAYATMLLRELMRTTEERSSGT